MKLKTDFLQSIEHCQGFDKEAFIEAHHQTPVVSIRINQSKTLEQSVVLDDDKKAAMVSNLMVVLCGEKSASPVLNTGSLY